MSLLYQITEEDLADLERTLPQIMHRDPMEHGRCRVQWARIKAIVSNIRFCYGPHSDIEIIPDEQQEPPPTI